MSTLVINTVVSKYGPWQIGSVHVKNGLAMRWRNGISRLAMNKRTRKMALAANVLSKIKQNIFYQYPVNFRRMEPCKQTPNIFPSPTIVNSGHGLMDGEKKVVYSRGNYKKRYQTVNSYHDTLNSTLFAFKFGSTHEILATEPSPIYLFYDVKIYFDLIDLI